MTGYKNFNSGVVRYVRVNERRDGAAWGQVSGGRHEKVMW